MRMKNINVLAAECWAGVVAQLVEWTVWTPEVHGSNVVIGEIL